MSPYDLLRFVGSDAQQAVGTVTVRFSFWRARIFDQLVPDIDGLEMVTAIRRLSNALIMIVSARDREDWEVEAKAAGANDDFTKPFDFHMFANHLAVVDG